MMTTEQIDQHSLFDEPPVRPGEYIIPDGSEPTVCRSCGAPIVWITTPTGRAMPLSLRTVRSIDGVRYATTHFADCPHGRAWRRR
jgi:hypothetical protein